jgi:anthranilate phosphoribosyltransferase
MPNILSTIENLKHGNDLSEKDMSNTFSLIMNGNIAKQEISLFLEHLTKKGESIEELTAAARILRDKANTIRSPELAVDCCGTGGDGVGTYNVSTAVSLISASCGIPVAKHGNRSSSSKSGAADIMETLGVNLNLSHEQLEESLKLFNFCFLMAPNHHKAMQHVVSVRKELGYRTIFNLIGPLANPANTKYQLIGVFDRKWLLPLAHTLNKLGTKKAWIVYGNDGLDEITTTDVTYTVKLDNGTISEHTLKPDDFGIKSSPLNELIGGDASHNASALLNLLKGEKNAYRDIVLINTSAVLNICNKVDNLVDGVAVAAKAIDEGNALELLNQYKEYSWKT